MDEPRLFKIITFYQFRQMKEESLVGRRDALTSLMIELSIKGTVILAAEGFNSTVGGRAEDITKFVDGAEKILETSIPFKMSFHDDLPFRRIKIKIKPEIVTLRKTIDQGLGDGTHVSAAEWNELISDPETLVLDVRNDYEYKTGTFVNALNPRTQMFNQLPDFVAQNMDAKKHKRVAMFCTGGIRCEKFVPYMKGLGFESVYQLNGGVLQYLDEVSPEESLWQGECYVFDERITVDEHLKKGSRTDFSQAKEK